jgi:hypothetical protein
MGPICGGECIGSRACVSILSEAKEPWHRFGSFAALRMTQRVLRMTRNPLAQRIER